MFNKCVCIKKLISIASKNILFLSLFTHLLGVPSFHCPLLIQFSFPFIVHEAHEMLLMLLWICTKMVFNVLKRLRKTKEFFNTNSRRNFSLLSLSFKKEELTMVIHHFLCVCVCVKVKELQNERQLSLDTPPPPPPLHYLLTLLHGGCFQQIETFPFSLGV